MKSVVVLLGAPGAGKGTQAARLSEELSLPHVATGDLLREHRARGTALGKEAQRSMDAGELVADALVLDMLFERVAKPDCADGFLLDGFPRTLAQASALKQRLGQVDLRVLDLEVSDETIVERAAGRLLCKECGAIYHTESAPPAQPGVCDSCGGELYQRKDDAPDVVRERLRVYHEKTRPLVDFYRREGVLESLDGERTPDAVYQSLLERIRRP
jgi:adenylate kinase